jgi:hypothetical protein
MRRYWSTVYIALAVVLILFFGLLGRVPLGLRWLLVIAVFVALLVMVGREVTGNEVDVRLRSGRTETRFAPGRVDGVLIDARNKISLSRLQLILWTVVILSAWVTLALHRVIPVIQGRLFATDTQLVQEVAGLLAGGEEPGEADVRRAAAVLEQITGADVTIPAEDGTDEAAPAVLYDPLAIGLPQEVLLALGISITSLAGAGLIKTNQATNDEGRAQEVALERTRSALERASIDNTALEKAQGEYQDTLESLAPALSLESLDVDPQARADALAAAELDPAAAAKKKEVRVAEAAARQTQTRAEELVDAQMNAVGELHANPSIADARWSDMMRGDTVANFQFADLGKIQMFFFTVILVFTYAALIWSIMSMPQAGQVLQLVPSMSLPAFSESLVLTLALSHGGYLATKTTV